MARATKSAPRRLRLRPALGTETFEPIQEEATQIDDPHEALKDHPLKQLPATALRALDNQVCRHNAGQFDIRLSYPVTAQPDPNQPSDENRPPHSGGKKIVYGCNFVRREEISPSLKMSSGIGDTVFVIASPVALEDEEVLGEEPKVLVDQMSPAALDAPQLSPQPHTPQKVVEPGGEARPSPTAQDGCSLSVTSVKSVPSPSPRTTQIEDSVEALDRLEEELEAVNAVAHFGRVLSPESTQKAKGTSPASNKAAAQKPGLRRTASTTKRPPARPSTVRISSIDSRSAPAKSRSVSVGPGDNKAKDGEETESTKQSPARKPVLRPNSLAPPKPLAKSNKPRTVPAFELPGESVARRLKEQKEARLSLQVSPEQASKTVKAVVPQRAKSTKVPTRPTFELPGEAISRKKREEREARLKAEQEEERKRREFKARPIRTSFAPNTLPRETIASRARQNKMAHDENAGKSINGSRRVSATGPGPGQGQGATSNNGSPQSRGRGTAAMPSSQVSRATSASTGSVSGKRSTLSAEEAYQQKLRGKEIYERDNSFSVDKEKERRDREANARLAREQAAERSRQASREWAEKQRRKTLAPVQASPQATTASSPA